MFLSQLKGGGVICRINNEARLVNGVQTSYELAKQAIQLSIKLSDKVRQLGLGDTVNLEQLLADGALDCPMRHPDAAHMMVTGTGLTHLGSASARDAMHKAAEGETDSMKMFRMGLEGGKPAANETGVQPEWFYKGTGSAVVAPGAALVSPDFALDGSEEPEIAGIYINSDEGRPYRVGYALANEFSDHVTERVNYLYLAHSKLRQTCFGPEIFVGDLPQNIQGISRIKRGDSVLWEKPFLSGEENMSHTIANLEHHHFKYEIFRAPGDLHVHMFGTATLSFADGIKVQDGDVIEIQAAEFGLVLHNPVATAVASAPVVEAL